MQSVGRVTIEFNLSRCPASSSSWSVLLTPVEVSLLKFALLLSAADEKKKTIEHQRLRISNLQLTLFHMCSIFFCMKSLVATCWSFTNRFCPVTVCWVRIQNTIKDQRLKISDLQLTFIQICRIFYSMKSFVGPRWSRTARFCPVTACSRRIKITNEHQQSKDENLDSATYHFSILHPPSAEVSSYPFFFAWRISLTLRAPTSICFSGSKLLRVCGTVLRV